MTIVYSKQAYQFIRKMHPDVRRELKEIIESLLSNPYAGKALKRDLINYRSLMFKKYRVIYRIQSPHLQIHWIDLRKHIYEVFDPEH